MNISTTTLILWGCVIWMPAMFYLLLSNETKFKKNIAVGRIYTTYTHEKYITKESRY